MAAEVDQGERRASRDDFELADWRVRPSLNRLSRVGRTVQLEPKLMDVLLFLARRGGEVVSKNDITDAVWSEQFITDSVVTRAIAELRRALGDDAHAPRYIETISKRGYRLIAPVTFPRPAPEPTLEAVARRPPPGGRTPGSPFVAGQWVRGERFYGRAAEIGEILDGPRNWLWLLGSRRIGKTSVLKQLEHLADPRTGAGAPERGYLPIFWDLQGIADPAELHRDFGDALLDAEERLAARGIALAEVEDGDLFVSLGRLRRRLRSQGLRLLLLCDEVEELIQLGAKDPALLRKLRRAMQSREDIRSVLASSVRLWALAEQKEDTSPFLHGFTPPLYLGNLGRGEARALIRQQQLAAERRPKFDDDTVEAIRRRCGDHPYLIQLVCRRRLEIDDLEEVFEEVASDPTVGFFFAADLELLTDTERAVLGRLAERSAADSEALADGGDPALGRALRGGLQRLTHLGFVRRDEERRYRLVNPFFRRWLQETSSAASPASPTSRPSSPKSATT